MSGEIVERSPTCETCRHFAPLAPGQAAICFKAWQDLKWNDAVPLTTKGGWCDKHEPTINAALAEKESQP